MSIRHTAPDGNSKVILTPSVRFIDTESSAREGFTAVEATISGRDFDMFYGYYDGDSKPMWVGADWMEYAGLVTD